MLFFLPWVCTFSFQSPFYNPLNIWKYSLSPLRTVGYSKMSFSPVRSVKSLSQAIFLPSVFSHAIFYPISRSTTIFSQTSSAIQVSRANQVSLALVFGKYILPHLWWRNFYNICLQINDCSWLKIWTSLQRLARTHCKGEKELFSVSIFERVFHSRVLKRGVWG